MLNSTDPKPVQVHFRVPYPILLCTYTNVAVDHLVEGLVTASLSPLRIGYNGKVKPSLITHTLENKLAEHPLAAKLQRAKDQLESTMQRLRALEKRIEELKEKNMTRYEERLHAMEVDGVGLSRQIDALRAKTYGMYLRMVRDIVTTADVVSAALEKTVGMLQANGQFNGAFHSISSIELLY